MSHDIFISYSRKDLQQVIAIRDELKEKVGADSWIDIKGIESGEQFVNVIIEAIENAKIVLFMFSASSLQSEYAKKEIMYAKNKGKKIVPVILDNSPLSGWFLFEFGMVDYIDIHDDMHKQKLLENMKSWLGLENNGQGPLDLFDVGLHYYLKNDYQVALDWFQKAAAFQYADAQYYIGRCFNHGRGTDADYDKALEWYKKAAAQNHSEAQRSIGLLYKFGLGVEQDDKKALEWYRKSADNGNVEAQYEIGKCYYFGRGVDLDFEEAVRWFSMTAEKGFVKAEASLGYCYFSGEGVEKDYKKAVYWFEKAALQGTTAAQYHLGHCYYHGLGVPQDYKQAVYWFDQASKQNHGTSEYYLGLCYLYGQGVPQNGAEARVRFRKALKQGYEGEVACRTLTAGEDHKNNKDMRTTPEFITELQPNEVFVFGSNLQGMHGGGAALIAYRKFGAIMGQGVGLQGQSYGIPTMQGGVETIRPYVDEFIQFAKAHPELTFLVTRIGCGIAGFTDDEISPLFAEAHEVENIVLPPGW